MVFKEHPIVLGTGDLLPNRIDRAWGRDPAPQTMKIDHIMDVPHFVEKSGAPLLQLADACAFAFRRCLERQTHGDDLVLAMLGPAQGHDFITDEVWHKGTSGGLFNQGAYASQEQKTESWLNNNVVFASEIFAGAAEKT